MNVSYKDVWTWGDVQAEWTNKIFSDHPALYNTIQAANSAAGDDMGAFLCWLGVRVLEMHRVLKPTGSLYLHIDHTAHAYVKMMLDAIFGRDNFRNEVVWFKGYRGTPRKRRFQQEHDTVLFYAKTSDYKWNETRGEYRDQSMSRYNKIDENGQRYALIKRRRTDGTVYYGKTYPKGKLQGDVIELPVLAATAKERTGYPTQKPLSLYERIIKASSNPGNIVLDPFAGCATTCVAAERLGRQWIGVDINEQARDVIHDRLQREVSEGMAWREIVRTPTEPPERTDGGDPVAPELRIVGRQRRRPRRLPVREIREQLIISNGQRCQGCGWEPPYPDYLQVDHKKPRSLGGADEMSNYTLLCDPCNRRKSNKLTLVELRRVRVDEGRVDADWWEEAKWQ